MSTRIQRYQTARFIDWSLLLALGAWVLIPIAWFAALFLTRDLTNKMVSVVPNQATLLNPIQPRKALFGAVRVDAIAQLSNNTWVMFEIQVRDNQGNVLVSAVKQAWKESGRWEEDGESGTWSEQDLRGRLEIHQNSITSPLVISLTVLEQGSVDGQLLTEPVIFQVVIKDGIVDDRFLIGGLIIGLILVFSTIILVKESGQLIIARRIDDSEIEGQGEIGGPERLITVSVRVIINGKPPSQPQVDLYIEDMDNTLVYHTHKSTIGIFSKNNQYTETVKFNIILEPRGSYVFSVKVRRGFPVKMIHVKVKEGVHTLTPVDVVHLQFSSL